MHLRLAGVGAFPFPSFSFPSTTVCGSSGHGATPASGCQRGTRRVTRRSEVETGGCRRCACWRTSPSARSGVRHAKKGLDQTRGSKGGECKYVAMRDSHVSQSTRSLRSKPGLTEADRLRCIPRRQLICKYPLRAIVEPWAPKKSPNPSAASVVTSPIAIARHPHRQPLRWPRHTDGRAAAAPRRAPRLHRLACHVLRPRLANISVLHRRCRGPRRSGA